MDERTLSIDAATAASRDTLEQDLGLVGGAALLDAFDAPVCALDGEGRILCFNRTCERLSGCTADEVSQRPFWEVLVPEDDVERVKEAFLRLVEGQAPDPWESPWINKHGERRVIRWRGTVLGDGDCRARVLATGVDITEQRRLEGQRDGLLEEERRARELAEVSERRAAFLAEASRVLSAAFEDPTRVLDELARLAVPYLASWCAVRVVDERGLLTTPVFVHVDPKKQARLAKLEPHVFTLPAEQALPATVAEGRSLLVNGGASCLARFSSAFPKLEGAVRRRAAAILLDAGMASFIMVPLAARGRLVGAMLLVSADERCQYGPVQLGLAEALATHAALALDNARLYLKAQRALQAREDFLVIASHELKTPLTSLQMAVQALLRQVREGGPCAAPLLTLVERSTVRLGTLADDLLDIARFTATPPIPSLEEVDLGAVLAEAVERSAEALRNAGCALSQAVQGPMIGRWDRRWLVRIVGHLLSNAAKYGSGRPIEVRTDGDERAVQLVVRDHGIGISAEEQARIFQRFERAVPVRHYGGFGLGLWLVRQLVETLGGTVRVESRVGEGATFTVELPRRAPGAPEGMGAGAPSIQPSDALPGASDVR